MPQSEPHTKANDEEARVAPSVWSPLQKPLFRYIWFAMLVSNIGTWMQDMGAGWLMATMTDSSLQIALIQSAATLPFFLLAVPAGTLADIVNRRVYLLITITIMAIAALLTSVFTYMGMMTPWLLIGLTFLLGVGTAMMRPAWAASIPVFVGKEDLHSAITLNAMSMNASRAVGPVLAGLVIVQFGPGAVFLVNFLSFLGLLVVFWQWRGIPSKEETGSLPVERFVEGMKAGLRFAKHEPALRNVLIKGVCITLFAGIVFALLPVLGVKGLGLSAREYGFFISVIGAGAVIGALILPFLQNRLSLNAIVTGSAMVYAITLVLMVSTEDLLWVSLALTVNGVVWLTLFSCLVVASQLSVPDWIRARGLALTMLAFFGSIAIGSALWGEIAGRIGLAQTFYMAAAGIIVSLALTWRVRISGDQYVSQSAVSQWPLPEYADDIQSDSGPVMVILDFQVEPENQPEFFKLMQEMQRVRLRDGAFYWELFMNPEKPNEIKEIFLINSWLDRLRQRERMTLAGQELRRKIRRLDKSERGPMARYLFAGRDIDNLAFKNQTSDLKEI